MIFAMYSGVAVSFSPQTSRVGAEMAGSRGVRSVFTDLESTCFIMGEAFL